MLINPHTGTELEAPWQQGFAAGFLAADQDLSPPSPLTPDAQDAFTEGVSAGRFSIQGMRIPPVAPPESEGDWESLWKLGAEQAAEHTLFEIAKHSIPKTLGRAAVGSFGLASAFVSVVSIAIFGPDRSEPFFDEAALRGLERVLQQISSQGMVQDDQNIELFMAACDLPDHGLGTQDEMLRQGFWHGRVFLDFESARAEAESHGHPDDTVICRFQTAAPGLVELVDLS